MWDAGIFRVEKRLRNGARVPVLRERRGLRPFLGCGGLEQAVKSALMHSGKFLPWQVVVLSTDGHILSE